MAIAKDNIQTYNGSSSPLTVSYTVSSGSNGVLFVFVALNSGRNCTGITYNGVALTSSVNYSANGRRIQAWYLVNPDEGAHDLVFTGTFDATYGLAAGAMTLFGVNTSSPVRNSATGTGSSYTPSLGVTSQEDDLVLSAIMYMSTGTLAAGSGQTKDWEKKNGMYGNTVLGGGSSVAGATGTVTMDWVNSGGAYGDSYYAMCALSIEPTAPVSDLEEDLPSLTIISGCDGVVESLPLLSLVNCYVDVPHADVDESLPILTISATAEQSTVIAGDCTLPVLTISSLTGYQTDSELEVNLPAPTASASSLTGEIYQGDIDVPLFTISATLLSGGISQGVATIPIFTFVGKTINTGTVSQSVPVLTISAYAHGPLLHTLDESLPLLQIVANLVQQSTAFRCYVLNTENSAITEYDNFPFNSFCTFKGKHLAAGANGITLLEGSKDNSTDISAYLNVGTNDFDLPNIKKITDAYLSMKGDGSYYLTVTSDDGSPHSYLLTATTGDRIRNLKTHVGKGKKGRFFELELSNIAGADFELYDMVLNVELLKRNI